MAKEAALTDAVERRVKAQVHALHGTAAVLREFAQAHDKYASDYAKLPVAPAPATGGKRADAERVAHELETTVRAVTEAHAALANELNSAIVAPIEAFEKQQRHQTKQLLSEIENAVQSERQLHAALEAMSAKGQAETTPTDDNQDPEITTTQGSDAAEAQATKAQRDRVRDVVRQRLAELDLTDEQQNAIIHSQLTRCFDAMTRHASQVLTDVGEKLTSLTLSATSQRIETATLTADEALEVCSLHIDVTGWMLTLFSQMAPIEEAMMKRLQSLQKTHAVVNITTVFGPSSSASTAPTQEATSLWDLTQSHRQFAGNLADPISRALRFSKQKQETIRKELVESLDELQKQVQVARNKVKDKESKLLQFLQQEQMQQQRQESQPPASLGSTGMEAMLSSGTAGLRNAVVSWTKQLSSPKKPLLFKSKSVNSVGVFGSGASAATISPPSFSPSKVSKSPRREALEEDLMEARALVQTLEANEAVQRGDIAITLENTALIGVKTMELMVSEYLKIIIKAMNLAAVACASNNERLTEAPQHTQSFQAIQLFDDGDFSDNDLLKQLGGGEKNLVPEAAVSETESEEPEDLVVPSTTGSSIADLGTTTSQSTLSLSNEQALAQPFDAIVVELSKHLEQLRTNETAHHLVMLAKKFIVVAWQGLTALFRSVERFPGHWQCGLAFAIILSLLNFVRRLNRLDQGWDDLAELQRANARGLQELVALINE